jgi:hypothetical protein
MQINGKHLMCIKCMNLFENRFKIINEALIHFFSAGNFQPLNLT